MGQWLNGNEYGAWVDTWSPAHGGTLHREVYNSTSAPGPLLGQPFGDAAVVLPATSGRTVSADATIQPGSLSVAVHLDDPTVQETAEAHAGWGRFFQLDPHSSVSFSGYADFNEGSDTSPSLKIEAGDFGLDDRMHVKASSGYSSVLLWARLDDYATLYDSSVVNRNVMIARDAFGFSAGPDGRMVLTATNTADTPLYGRFFLDVQTYTVSSVPEPQTWLALLAGMGLLGLAAVRRRRRATLRR